MFRMMKVPDFGYEVLLKPYIKELVIHSILSIKLQCHNMYQYCN